MPNFVNLLDIIYPVGSIYISANATSPADSIGGTWEQIENCLLAASGDIYNLAGRYAGDDMIPMAAVPDHQHPVVSVAYSTTTLRNSSFLVYQCHRW